MPGYARAIGDGNVLFQVGNARRERRAALLAGCHMICCLTNNAYLVCKCPKDGDNKAFGRKVCRMVGYLITRVSGFTMLFEGAPHGADK